LGEATKTITVEEIAERAASAVGAPPEEGIRIFFSALNVMRQEVMKGTTVELPNLATLAPGPSGGVQAAMTVRAAPRTAGWDEGGEPPAGATLVMPAAPQAQQATAALEAAAAVGEAARGAAGSRILFVVPARDMFTNIIAQKLAGTGSELSVAEGIEQGLSMLEQARPDLVVIDGNLPGTERMIREVKLNRDRGLISAVCVYPEGIDPAEVVGLHVCEDETLQEPYDMTDLVKIADTEIRRIAEERNFFEQEIHFQFQTSEEYIEQANDLVARLIDQASIEDEKAAALSVAFREAVDNAARHGNKNQEHKVVDAIYLLDRQKVTVTVEDEGEGFDTELYLTRGIQGNAVAAARERNQAGRVGGLGIMLMLKCLDDLEYNYVGNLVKLTKYR
jgi:anti-sigma regulatory factor (Ser/Thr protein kinase)